MSLCCGCDQDRRNPPSPGDKRQLTNIRQGKTTRRNRLYNLVFKQEMGPKCEAKCVQNARQDTVSSISVNDSKGFQKRVEVSLVQMDA